VSALSYERLVELQAEYDQIRADLYEDAVTEALRLLDNGSLYNARERLRKVTGEIGALYTVYLRKVGYSDQQIDAFVVETAEMRTLTIP
jgi:hypothetical protein